MPLLDFVEGAEPTPGSNLFVGFLTLLLLMPSIYQLFLYVMRALGLYRIAKRRGIHHPWLAWVPCGRDWLLGSISDHYQYVVQGKGRCFRIFLLVLSVFTALALFLVQVFAWELPLGIMNVVYSDFLKAFLHAPLVSKTLLPTTICLVVALLVIRLFPLYQLYQSSLPRYKLPLLILNILVPFTPAVTIFAVRDYDKGMPSKHTDPTPS